MPPDSSPGEALFPGGQLERCRDPNPATLQAGADLEEMSSDCGQTEIPGNPQEISRLAIAPLQPSTARRPLPQKGQGRRDLVVSG